MQSILTLWKNGLHLELFNPGNLQVSRGHNTSGTCHKLFSEVALSGLAIDDGNWHFLSVARHTNGDIEVRVDIKSTFQYEEQIVFNTKGLHVVGRYSFRCHAPDREENFVWNQQLS
jgi:hypothetical protein